MSYRTSITALALLAAAPLAAQEPARTIVIRPGFNGQRTYTVDGGMMASQRGVIGVGLDMRPGPNDTIGATISSVTPGSAAAGAGIVAGDIITKFDGTPLVERGRRTAMADDGDAQSQPGLRMLELASHMSPGDTVAVEWKHERQRKTAQLVAQPAATMVYSDNMPGPDVRFFTDEGPGRFKFNFQDTPDAVAQLQGRLERLRTPLGMNGMPGEQMWFRVGGPLGGVQFAPLNADLGRYFGTTDGILVLDTPDTSAHIDLKGGDVILAIGDRKPANVEHLLRILGSYQDDEVVHFDVMRDHRRMTIDAKAKDLQPAGEMNFFRRSIEATPVPDRVETRTLPPPSEPRRRRPGA